MKKKINTTNGLNNMKEIKKALQKDRKRILKLILDWESTNFGDIDNRIDAFKIVKKNIMEGGEEINGSKTYKLYS
jgi:hypothetical protein